jgi:hypothetical protein
VGLDSLLPDERAQLLHGHVRALELEPDLDHQVDISESPTDSKTTIRTLRDPLEKSARGRRGDHAWYTVPSQGVRLHAVVTRLCPRDRASVSFVDGPPPEALVEYTGGLKPFGKITSQWRHSLFQFFAVLFSAWVLRSSWRSLTSPTP